VVGRRFAIPVVAARHPLFHNARLFFRKIAESED
jgi:hypothetical protein